MDRSRRLRSAGDSRLPLSTISDFSYRAFLAGARVTIACDLALIHASRGSFDAAWGDARSAFAVKHPHLDAAPGAHRHWHAVALPDETSVTRHYAKLFAAWQLALPAA